jgi:beta-lactamase regulating signal transducer with metallopeptidase domain
MNALLLTCASKGALLLGSALVMNRLLRRAAASLRHALLLFALVGSSGLFAAALLLPTLPLPFWPAATPSAVDASRGVRAAAPLANGRADQDEGATTAGVSAAISPTASADRATIASIDSRVERARLVESLALALWVAGVLLSLLPWLVGRGAVLLLVRGARPPPERFLWLLRGLVRELRLKRLPDLALVERRLSPMTFGMSSPVLLLPAAALEWSEERLRAVLLHELAHVKRRDDLAHALARFGCALHWFDPLAWIALRRLRRERELACDDVVLRSGHRPADYAATLVELARSLRPGGALRLAGVATMAEPATLEERVAAALDGDRSRSSPRRAIVAGAACLALVALLVLACAGPARPTGDAVPPRDGILERIAAERSKALADLHHLHLVVSGQQWDWDEASQQWTASRARWHARAWYEGGPDERFRVDQDPRFGRWIGGAAPFVEYRDSVAWDGELYRKYDHCYFDGQYQSRLSESRPYYPAYAPLEGISGRPRQQRTLSLFGRKFGVGSTPGTLFPHAEVGGFIGHLRESDDTHFDISTDADGMTVLELRFRDVQSTRFVLDPAKHYATLSETTTSLKSGRPFRIWQATAWKQLSRSLWLPTAWDDQFPSGAGGHRNTVVLDSAGYFSPANADAIFTMAEIDTKRRSRDAPAGPDFADVSGPP